MMETAIPDKCCRLMMGTATPGQCCRLTMGAATPGQCCRLTMRAATPGQCCRFMAGVNSKKGQSVMLTWGAAVLDVDDALGEVEAQTAVGRGPGEVTAACRHGEVVSRAPAVDLKVTSQHCQQLKPLCLSASVFSVSHKYRSVPRARAHTHTHTRARMHTLTHTLIHTCMHPLHTLTHTLTHTHARTHPLPRTHTHTHTHTQTCVRTSMNTRAHKGARTNARTPFAFSHTLTLPPA